MNVRADGCKFLFHFVRFRFLISLHFLDKFKFLSVTASWAAIFSISLKMLFSSGMVGS